MATKPRIGILGGSFDPIHKGHLNLADTLATSLSLDKVYFIPAYQNPLKKETSHVLPQMRLHLVEIALVEWGDARFKVIDFEILNAQPSFTVDTVLHLEQQEDAEWVSLMGSDVFKTLPKWKLPQVLFSKLCFAVIKRDQEPFSIDLVLKQCGIDYSATPNGLFALSNGLWVREIPMVPLPYSSTQIRREIHTIASQQWNAQPPLGLQHSVWLLIKENQLYSV